jgi:hypothetical protein
VELPDGVAVVVIVIGFSDEDATIGSVTPLHRFVVSEKTQHESVLFGELAAQYEHNEPRFDVNPQLSDWFSTASIQLVVNESAGRAQFVKSARTCVSAPESAVPQTLLAVISCSLSAYAAQESAHKGLAASPARLHGWTEFCTMALQRTLVV